MTRKVTNVGRSTATYTASVTGLDGIKAKVSPSTLTLKAGETKSFTVTFTRTDAAMNAYVGGHLTWKEQQAHRTHPAGGATGAGDLGGPVRRRGRPRLRRVRHARPQG